MKTLRKRLTRGDYCTQPGGVVLRQKDDGEYVVHTFNRAYGSDEPTEFYWGRYTHDLREAELAFSEKVGRATDYDTGGSLIDHRDEARELRLEREKMRGQDA